MEVVPMTALSDRTTHRLGNTWKPGGGNSFSQSTFSSLRIQKRHLVRPRPSSILIVATAAIPMAVATAILAMIVALQEVGRLVLRPMVGRLMMRWIAEVAPDVSRNLRLSHRGSSLSVHYHRSQYARRASTGGDTKSAVIKRKECA